MTQRRTTIAIILGCSLLGSSVYAGWQDLMKPLEGVVSKTTGQQSAAGSALSQQDMTSGIKEALSVGIQRTIELLGKDGGFLNNAQVKIPLPSALQKIEKGLRAAGQANLADEFVATMNHAAERAVPETAAIFGDAIKGMSLEDAQGILKGPDNAATQYFQKASGERLQAAILPIVKQATAQAGVTSAYKKLLGGAGFLSSFMDSGSLDLDQYVTGKTMDGLFLKLAEEEKQIRENPVARSSDLLKKVFGSLGG